MGQSWICEEDIYECLCASMLSDTQKLVSCSFLELCIVTMKVFLAKRKDCKLFSDLYVVCKHFLSIKQVFLPSQIFFIVQASKYTND
jgi:hypothetical protein